jgi:hypothetical protein
MFWKIQDINFYNPPRDIFTGRIKLWHYFHLAHLHRLLFGEAGFLSLVEKPLLLDAGLLYNEASLFRKE